MRGQWRWAPGWRLVHTLEHGALAIHPLTSRALRVPDGLLEKVARACPTPFSLQALQRTLENEVQNAQQFLATLIEKKLVGQCEGWDEWVSCEGAEIPAHWWPPFRVPLPSETIELCPVWAPDAWLKIWRGSSAVSATWNGVEGRFDPPSTEWVTLASVEIQGATLVGAKRIVTLAEQRKRWIGATLGPAYGGATVDVGCGNGDLERWILDDAQGSLERWLGLDADSRRLAAARQVPGFRCEFWDARSLDWRFGAFDTVILSEVIEHWPPDTVAERLESILRGARPRLLLLTIPMRKAGEKFRHPEHEWELDADGAQTLLRTWLSRWGGEGSVEGIGARKDGGWYSAGLVIRWT